MPQIPFLVLVSAGMVGCASDQGLGKVSDVDGAEGPAIQVEPPALAFGALTDGEVASLSFTVANIGPEESVLDVSAIRLEGVAAGSYTLITDGAFSLFGGAPPEEFEVVFSPVGANEQEAVAVVDSNDTTNPHAGVDLVGEGLVPELEISPDPLDMGITYVGCDKQNTLTFTNVGEDTLVVSAIDADRGVNFPLTIPVGLPFSLEPHTSLDLPIAFVPTVEGSLTNTLRVTSNEPLGVREAIQTGAGAYAAEYSDSFEVPADPRSDILFYVDQSCSMDDDARSLGTNFATFIDTLSKYTSDWQIAVANDDDGCNNSGILTPGAPNFQSVFQNAVRAGGGTWTEAGLTVTSHAIDLTDPSECNDGFLRTDAMLHIIMVSDEPEQSARAWDSYVTEVINKKGDPSLVKFSAVAGPSPSGCTDMDNTAEYGSGYFEAVSYTSGEFLSICDDWGTNVDILATASVSVNTFELSHTPAPASVVVTVNGVEVTTGWTYNSATNAVVFDETSAPTEGDAVEVDYAGLASCD